MTETKTDLGACVMGASTEHPCPYPAIMKAPRNPSVGLCAFHGATDPLYEETDQLHLALEMLPAYLKGARRAYCEPLITVLERARLDFTGRLELIEGALDDLKEAEETLYSS